MTDTFTQIHEQSDRVLAHTDRIRGYLFLAQGEKDITRLAVLQEMMEAESQEMTRDSERFTELLDQFKKERGTMIRRNALMTLALILIALFPLLVSSVNAQDTLATNTPIVQAVEATPEPTVAPAATVQPATTIVTDLPTQSDPLDTFMKYGLLIGIVLIIVLGVLFDRVATHLALGVPQYAWDTTKAGGENVLASLKTKVEATATPLDDLLLPYLQSAFEKWSATVDQQRLNPTTTGNSTPGVVNVNVTATPPTGDATNPGGVG